MAAMILVLTANASFVARGLEGVAGVRDDMAKLFVLKLKGLYDVEGALMIEDQRMGVLGPLLTA